MKSPKKIGAAVALSLLVATGAQAMPSGNSGGSSGSAPTYSAAEKAVKAKQYQKAIAILKKVVAKQPGNVDAYNYLGYSYRQLGDYKTALGHYTTALKLDKNHRGANEYLGQLYLKTGNVAAAKAQLARLKTICGTGCEEYESLKQAIAKQGA